MAGRMTAGLVCESLQMALWRRQKPEGVILHADHGSQHCSSAYQDFMEKQQIICSMSGRGKCCDKAWAESFFHSLKVEAIHGKSFATGEEMRQTVFEYIEVDYNRSRRHSANGYISPMTFEALKHA